jgi:hypothetical protein
MGNGVDVQKSRSCISIANDLKSIKRRLQISLPLRPDQCGALSQLERLIPTSMETALRFSIISVSPVKGFVVSC